VSTYFPYFREVQYNRLKGFLMKDKALLFKLFSKFGNHFKVLCILLVREHFWFYHHVNGCS